MSKARCNYNLRSVDEESQILNSAEDVLAILLQFCNFNVAWKVCDLV